jgi:hypothetical protein
VQGFLFARPQPIAEIVKLLASGLKLPEPVAMVSDREYRVPPLEAERRVLK